jgi:F420H(2)-dependent quinone reductase
VALGFVAEPDGALLVAATEAGAAWARNLEAEPRCTVVIGERRFAAVAEPLERPDHIHAVRELILRYGTPSEGLGRGPSFRLRPSVTD